MRREVTPQRAFELEQALDRLLRQIGRVLVQWLYNRIEPDEAEKMPQRIRLGLDEYRRNRRTPRRHGVACLFGKISLSRFVYQSVVPGEASVFPLERALGIVRGLATPALADCVGRLVADLPQQGTLLVLRERFAVSWSVASLRKVTAALAEELSPLRHVSQVARVIELLGKAFKSQGKRAVQLVVGRDGVMVPMRPFWNEASAATVSVYDRKRNRLGTVYLGRMPESGQGTMTEQLSRLLEDVFLQWSGSVPKLVYVTDAGDHPQKFYRQYLKRMRHPRTGKRLEWQWIVDYFHVAERITTMAKAIFGDSDEGTAWAEKMRKTLKSKPSGVARLLRSAKQLRRTRGLRSKKTEFQTALNFLAKYRRHMNYAGYRKRGLVIGSGVTEAACKSLVNQRLKQSGMRWLLEPGQAVLDLRVLTKSKVWPRVLDRWLATYQSPQIVGHKKMPPDRSEIPELLCY